MQALLALSFVALVQPQPQEAQEWFRAMEERIIAAKALKLFCKSSVEVGTNVYRVDVKLWAAQGNKLRIEAVAGLGGKKDDNIVIVSDGSKLAIALGAKTNALLRDTDMDSNRKLLELTARCAVGTMLDELLRPGTQLKAGEIELSKFKLGAREKADSKREAQLIEYEVAVKEKAGHLKVKLWIDTKTLLPIRRVLTITTAGKEARFIEEFSEFTLDPALDAKLFVLPN